MKKTHSFHPNAERYEWDYALCPQGWAQLDTPGDAWYYGHWVNLATFQITILCEGDLYETTCDNLEEFVTEVRDICERFEGKIDPGLNESRIQAWRQSPLADCLH